MGDKDKTAHPNTGDAVDVKPLGKCKAEKWTQPKVQRKHYLQPSYSQRNQMKSKS